MKSKKKVSKENKVELEKNTFSKDAEVLHKKIKLVVAQLIKFDKKFKKLKGK